MLRNYFANLSPFLWLAVAALPCALAILALALRGRLINSNPHCRKCRFDLSGHANPTTCPECGRDLKSPKSIQRGLRRPRRKLAIFAAIVSVILTCFISVNLRDRALNFNWNTVKPEWWLASEVQGDLTTQKPAAAMAEVLDRQSKHKLSRATTLKLVERGLTIQADTNAIWQRQWSDLIESAMADNLLTPEQLSRYARAYPTLTVTGRPVVEQNSQWAIKLHIGRSRLGPRLQFQMICRLVSVDVDGQPLSGYSFGDGGSGLNDNGGSALGLPGMLAAEPGRRTIRTRWHFETQKGDSFPSDAPILASWDQDFTIPVEIVPAGTPTVQLIHDDSLRPAIEHAITTKNMTVMQRDGRLDAGGALEIDKLPVPVAFGVFWRYEDPASPGTLREIPFRTTILPSGRRVGYGGTVPQDFVATKVDVILRPDPTAAAQSEDITKIWDGEIIFRDQPIIWQNAARQPIAPPHQ